MQHLPVLYGCVVCQEQFCECGETEVPGLLLPSSIIFDHVANWEDPIMNLGIGKADEAETVYIPTDSLCATQDYIEASRVQFFIALLDLTGDDFGMVNSRPPFVVTSDNKIFFISDGHHRCAAAILHRDPYVKVRCHSANRGAN